MKKSTSAWAKIARLSEDNLSKTLEEVEVAPPEKRVKKIESSEQEKKQKSSFISADAKDPAFSASQRILAGKLAGKKVSEGKKKDKKGEEELAAEQWLPGGMIGQLSVDLSDAGDSLILKSTVAGVKPEDIDITVEPDLITIRGERKQEEKIEHKNYFYRECFWGKFSRTLVLPAPVKPEEVRANIKNGILTVTLPKAEEKRKNIEIT